jgi:hypothetical protein
VDVVAHSGGGSGGEGDSREFWMLFKLRVRNSHCIENGVDIRSGACCCGRIAQVRCAVFDKRLIEPEVLP